MENSETTGRFLPSQVYSRWKWVARFGMMVVPMLVLLCGGLILFLTPNNYSSTALVEMENGRSPQETAKLLESSGVLDLVVGELELAQRLNLDHGTAEEILLEATKVKVISDTNLIEVAVTYTQKELAREIADALCHGLARYEKERVQNGVAEKIAKLDRLLLDARDNSAEKAVEISRIEKLQGHPAAGEALARELERARRASLVADTDVERLLVLRADAAASLLNSEPRLIVHSQPVIPSIPSNPKVGTELNNLALQALIAGLAVAVLLPYLCELAFPPQKDPLIIADVVYDM